MEQSNSKHDLRVICRPRATHLILNHDFHTIKQHLFSPFTKLPPSYDHSYTYHLYKEANVNLIRFIAISLSILGSLLSRDRLCFDRSHMSILLKISTSTKRAAPSRVNINIERARKQLCSQEKKRTEENQKRNAEESRKETNNREKEESSERKRSSQVTTRSFLHQLTQISRIKNF